MLRTVLLSASCLAAFVAMLSPALAGDRPNVVLILSDDQMWTDYGFMGHDAIETPALDRLAAEGVTYRRGYVPTALCRPSLMTIITGRYAHEHKVSGNDPAPVDGVEMSELRERLIDHVNRFDTIPKLLGEAGYVSHQSGKWWQGNYSRGGFTEGMTHGDPKRGGRHGDVGLKIGREGLAPVTDFIDRAVEDDKPFFVWYAPFMPHTPHTPPQRLLDKYTAEGRHPLTAKYYAMCEWFDETCGELLDHLEEKGVDDNTLVVYVCDNGWISRTPDMDSPEGWKQGFAPMSKQSPYDGGIRTPIILKWPKKFAGRMDDKTLVGSIDLMPTILAACGVDAPSDLPGLNLLPNATNNESLDRDALLGESFAHDVANVDDPIESLLYRSCIEGRWKLILSYDGKIGRYASVHQYPGGPQLFDLEADPLETSNLAAAHPEIVERLKKRIDDWYAVPDGMLKE